MKKHRMPENISKGLKGFRILILFSVLSLFATALDIPKNFKAVFIWLVALCFTMAYIWVLIFLRCPKCKQYIGEYGLLSPPINVPHICPNCGIRLKAEYEL